MAQEKFDFASDGLTLSGIVHVPDDIGSGERRPAFLVLHGFGSNKNSGNSQRPAEVLGGALLLSQRRAQITTLWAKEPSSTSMCCASKRFLLRLVRPNPSLSPLKLVSMPPPR